MATPQNERTQAELVDRWAGYLRPSRRSSFREACAQASLDTIHNAAQPLFATWNTSLTHESLGTLKTISQDDLLRKLVEILVIADDREQLDPWSASELPSSSRSYDIWVRDKEEQMVPGILALHRILSEKRLRPRTIKIRDYRMEPTTFKLCEAMKIARDLIGDDQSKAPNPSMVATLARNITENTGIAISHLSFGLVDSHFPAKDSIFFSPRFQETTEIRAIGAPRVYEATIELTQEHVEPGAELSTLRSASLDVSCEATAYWLERIFYEAAKLQILSLSIKSPWCEQLDRERLISKLTDFNLSHTKMKASDVISMLGMSKQTLRSISFRSVALSADSTWRELLTLIADEFQALTSFTLYQVRESVAGRIMPLDYSTIDLELLDGYREGLDMKLTGTYSAKAQRVVELSYSGERAGEVLRILAGAGHFDKRKALGL